MVKPKVGRAAKTLYCTTTRTVEYEKERTTIFEGLQHVIWYRPSNSFIEGLGHWRASEARTDGGRSMAQLHAYAPINGIWRRYNQGKRVATCTGESIESTESIVLYVQYTIAWVCGV